MRWSLLIVTFFFAACVAPNGYWNHAHGDPARFRQDAAQCVYESNLATASTPSSIFLSQQISQDIATGMRQGELQRLCMQAKGYYWVEGASQQTAQPLTVEKYPASTVASPNTSAGLRGNEVLQQQITQMAKEAGCARSPQPVMTAWYADVELYSVTCDSGVAVSYRCMVGRCDLQR